MGSRYADWRAAQQAWQTSANAWPRRTCACQLVTTQVAAGGPTRGEGAQHLPAPLGGRLAVQARSAEALGRQRRLHNVQEASGGVEGKWGGGQQGGRGQQARGGGSTRVRSRERAAPTIPLHLPLPHLVNCENTTLLMGLACAPATTAAAPAAASWRRRSTRADTLALPAAPAAGAALPLGEAPALPDAPWVTSGSSGGSTTRSRSAEGRGQVGEGRSWAAARQQASAAPQQLQNSAASKQASKLAS